MFYHGTTLENARKLLNGGEKESSVWFCSFDDYLYVWSRDEIKKEFDEDADPSETESLCLQMAFESAQITAAASENPQSILVVLEFDFPEADVYDDLSCENMEMARRVDTTQLDGLDLENSLLNIYTAKHNSRLDAFYLCGLQNNAYFNWNMVDKDLKDAVKTINEREIYLEPTYFEPYIITLTELNKFKP